MNMVQYLPSRAKEDKVHQEPKSIKLNDEDIVYHTFQPNEVPEQIRNGGGGMISKAAVGKENLRMILAEPVNQDNLKYFRYAIIHEFLDNKVSEQRDILDIEKEVFTIFEKENQNIFTEIKEEYIQSRIDFFQ
ncbi:hypothetical protein GW750_00635 [bacterium]|nr:hypothetical protein [bacterium]